MSEATVRALFGRSLTDGSNVVTGWAINSGGLRRAKFADRRRRSRARGPLAILVAAHQGGLRFKARAPFPQVTPTKLSQDDLAERCGVDRPPGLWPGGATSLCAAKARPTLALDPYASYRSVQWTAALRSFATAAASMCDGAPKRAVT
jgi:hypothetical protein